MSQFPPPGQQPMSPMSPMSPQYGQPGVMPTRTSAAAVTALIMGIIGCIPFLTSLVAVICGIIGIRATGNPQVRGRGMAIAGLVLGILGLVLWSIFGTAGIGVYLASRAPAKVAHQFVTDVAAGNVQAAMSNADASLTQPEVQAMIDSAKPWGALSNVTFPVRSAVSVNNTTTWKFVGAASFATGGAKAVELDAKKQPDGSYKVTAATIK